MPSHYEHQGSPVSAESAVGTQLGGGPDEQAMDEAAQALRQAEVEAAQPEPDINHLTAAQLEHMSIDELRAAANALDVPERAQITEQEELIAAIRRRLPR